MGKIEKLIKRLLSKPKDFTWDELVKILAHFGYVEMPTGTTGGSRRKFADQSKNIVSLHKPHPGSILKPYQIDQIVAHLKDTKKIT